MLWNRFGQWGIVANWVLGNPTRPNLPKTSGHRGLIFVEGASGTGKTSWVSNWLSQHLPMANIGWVGIDKPRPGTNYWYFRPQSVEDALVFCAHWSRIEGPKAVVLQNIWLLPQRSRLNSTQVITRLARVAEQEGLVLFWIQTTGIASEIRDLLKQTAQLKVELS